MDGEDGDDAAIRDKCGVAGVVSDEPAAPLLYYALRALQHRGQESAGIVTVNGTTSVHRGMGLVENVFDEARIRTLQGTVGVGHVRYATTGASSAENAQPVLVESIHGTLAIAHNGDIVNSGKLREELKAKGWAFLTTSDTEVAVRMLANELTQEKSVVRALRSVMRRLTGSYSLVVLVGDTLYAVRDPLGIKPLCYGNLAGGGFVVASESTALNVLGANLVRDVAPGEILEVTRNGVSAHPAERTQDAAHCMFEYVYFARGDSVLDGQTVHDVRWRIGERLAKEAPPPGGAGPDDIVVAVPDSGRTHALGYAQGTGLRFVEGLMKNRYVHRTFIMPDQTLRDIGVKMKLNPVQSVVRGKRVFLVDDSIVRGTTMRRIVTMLRDAGAREVHVRIGSPPIVAPCYLGIDMNTRQQLVAASHSIEEIRRMLGADSLTYLSLDGLVDATHHKRSDLCLGCLTSVYPLEIPGEKNRTQARLF